MKTVCLFADISGFTKVSEGLASKGVKGNEDLSFVINRYMEGMVKNFGKYGGDIIKFVGDAMIVMWPEEPATLIDTDLQRYERAKLTVRKSIECAQEIQKEMNNQSILKDVEALSVKMGIGYGPCSLLYVGGVFQRREYFTVGEALTYALKSEGECTSGGQIVVSQTAFQYCQDCYEFEEIISKKNEKFYLIGDLKGEGVKTRADAFLLRQQISAETYLKIAKPLQSCVPAAIMPFLQIGAEQFGSETRSLTVMFASLGVDLSSAETKQGMQKIQKIVTCIQEQVYRHQGSVNKLVMDDKGSTLICIWGLTPMAHDDDAARAILTGISMNEQLEKIEGTKCKIGISSGEMFSGVVGTSGGRKEFSVLGDVANLSARIMGGSKWGEINCDMNTTNLASKYFTFIYRDHIDFKGKSVSIPTFKPVWPSQEQKNITETNLPFTTYLKLWSNPMIIESGSKKRNDHNRQMISGEPDIQDQQENLAEEIYQYFEQCSDKKKPMLVAIRGDSGSGKTHFARCMIDTLREQEFCRVEQSIFASSLNSETSYEFLNIFRPLLQQMMTQFCKRQKGMTRELVIEKILQSANQQNNKASQHEEMNVYYYVEALCQIFKASNNKNLYGKQVQPIKQENAFVKRENYEEKDRVNIIKLVSEFLRLFTGEISQTGQLTPLILFLDNTHLMDPSSWELLEYWRDNCHNLVIFIIQKTDFGKICLKPDCKEIFSRVWYSQQMDQLVQIEMPPLTKKTLNQLLMANAQVYLQTHLDEVHKMTFLDPTKPRVEGFKKTEESSKEKAIELKQKWQLQQQFTSIHNDILDLVLKKCKGNPLMCLGYFVSLLQNGYTQMSSTGSVEPSGEFKACQEIKDFLCVPTPRYVMRQNLATLDEFIQQVAQKQNKRPGEYEQCIKASVLLKVATVLGDSFDTAALHAILPIRSQSLHTVNKLVKYLEEQNFLEIYDKHGDNLFARFNRPFLRESLYQVMLYKDQKSSMHGAAARYLMRSRESITPKHFQENESAEQHCSIQSKVIRQHLMISQDIKDIEKLSDQDRTELTVYRIQTLFQINPKAIVKHGFLNKAGGKSEKQKPSKRLVKVDNKNFKWYHNEEEFNKGEALGTVPLQYIYQLIPTKLEEKDAFSFMASVWYKKKAELEQREFTFGCSSQTEMNDWIDTLEFLKTKATVDAYRDKNIPFEFSIQQGQVVKRQQKQEKYNLLYDFGEQLKQKTQSGLIKPNDNVSTQNIDETSKVKETVQKLKLLYGVSLIGFSQQIKRTGLKKTVRDEQATLAQELPDNFVKKITEQISQFQKDPSDITSMSSYQRNNQRVSGEQKNKLRLGGQDKSSLEKQKQSNLAQKTEQINKSAQFQQNSNQNQQISFFTPNPVEVKIEQGKNNQKEHKRNHDRKNSDLELVNSLFNNLAKDESQLRRGEQPSFDNDTVQHLKQLIDDQLHSALEKIMQQNKEQMLQHSDQLKSMIQQHNQTNNLSSFIASDSPMKLSPSRIENADTKYLLLSVDQQDLSSPFKSFLAERPSGITSKKWKKVGPHQAKRVESEDELKDPEEIDEEQTFVKKPKPKKQAEKQLKNTEDKNSHSFVHFNDQQIHYPPPEQWENTSKAIYQQPKLENEVMEIMSHKSSDSNKKQYAICNRDSTCLLTGNKIAAGQKVEILSQNLELKFYVVKYRGKQGNYLMQDFKKVIDRQPPTQEAQQSEEKPINFFKEVHSLTIEKNLNKLTTTQIAEQSGQLLSQLSIESNLELKCPKTVTEVKMIKDWEKHMKKHKYSAIQRNLVQICHQKHKLYLDQFNSPDWKEQSNKNGLLVHHKNNAQGNIMLRCQKDMPFSVENLFLTIVDGDYRQKYDPDIEIVKFTQHLAANIYTIYQKSKKILVISPRDFETVCYMHKEQNGSISVIVFTDPQVQCTIAESSAAVRGVLHLAGWNLIKLSDKQTRVQYILDFDLKGWIPGYAMKQVMGLQAEQVNRLPSAVETYCKDKGRPH